MPERTVAEAFLQEKLDERNKNGLLRKLASHPGKIDFSSNDYLGLARSSALRNLPNHSPLVGATGSRLISGNSGEAEMAERVVAKFHGWEAALTFNCGYMANVGLLSAIAGRGDTIISDEWVHASIVDGIRLSHAEKFKFKHNDLDALSQKLVLAKGRVFVVVESLYSMDGDLAPLVEIAALCTRHGAYLIVDEAHALGVWGEYGRGFVCQYRLQSQVFAVVYTFGKALGLHGAAVCGSATLKEYLVNFARPFIYSTALPPHAYAQVATAYGFLPMVNRAPLTDLIRYFSDKAAQLQGVDFLPSCTQIQGIVVGDNLRAKALATQLLEAGIYAKAILSPTVPKGTERLRICLHTYNTPAEVDQLFTVLQTFTA